MALSKEERKFLEEEYIRCYEDIVYMCKNYCDIQTLKHGKIKLNLYPFQETVLGIMQKNNKIIINKSRQMGISTLVSALAMNKLLFNDGYRVSVFANKQKTSVEIIDKVKLIYNGLPTWLKGTQLPLSDNKLELKLPNGSIIKAFSSSSDEGRSLASNLCIIDEGCYIDKLEILYSAIYPTISTGGSIVLLSTPNRPEGFFYEHWNNAVNGKNGFVPIKLKWDLHPERDLAWREAQTRELGNEKLAAQEYDAEFAQYGNSVFSDENLKYIEETVEKPKSTTDTMNEFWYWDYPDYSKNYMTIVDTGRGDGGDDSTIVVIETESFTQVAEFQGQLDPHALAMRAKSTAIYYNNALLVVENTGIGEATCLELEAIEYDNLYKTNKSSDTPDSNQYINTYAFNDNLKTGFSNNVKTRPLILAKFQECLINKSIIIKSSRTLHELKTFVWLNGKAQASRGSHDDLIMPLAIACYLRETALMFASKSIAMSKQLVSNIAIYKNNEFNQMVNNRYDYNQQIIDKYGLRDYDIWGTNS